MAPLDLLDSLVLELEELEEEEDELSEELEEDEDELWEDDDDDISSSRIGLRLVESSLCGILREDEESDAGEATWRNANNCRFAAASLSVVLKKGDEEEDDDDEDDDEEEAGGPLIRRARGPVKGEAADGDPAVDGELS